MWETAARQLGRANSPAKRRMIYSGNIAGVISITALPRDEGARTFLIRHWRPSQKHSVSQILKDYAVTNVLTRALRRPACWECAVLPCPN
ncbi:hypothetical protein G5I_04715 [Acromyrmex echinatior]|uniref:Uncharacterized protein n=1 Tax=Acromyrmex echinatior TaxID=103372 RepID=F4WGE1_ACREC|nr:hypothetical protein G5I_04715 [Acromyrmex echinatior]